MVKLKREEYEAPEHGEVTIRGMLLSERMKLHEITAKGTERFIPYTLSCCVLNSKGRPLMDESSWDEFGGVYMEAALEMFAIAQRVSGMSEADVEGEPDAPS